MEHPQPAFVPVILKTIATHTVTYFVLGLLASLFFGYGRLFAETNLNLFMRQTTERLVMAGPLFQPLRGLLFGIVFFLLRDVLFVRKGGWLILWIVLLTIGIINTFGPALGSIEGMIYTNIPIWVQLKGLPEVVLQTLALAVVVVYWVRHAQAKWLSWFMGIAFALTILFPLLGLLVGNKS
jgi:hypothetical protein